MGPGYIKNTLKSFLWREAEVRYVWTCSVFYMKDTRRFTGCRGRYQQKGSHSDKENNVLVLKQKQWTPNRNRIKNRQRSICTCRRRILEEFYLESSIFPGEVGCKVVSWDKVGRGKAGGLMRLAKAWSSYYETLKKEHQGGPQSNVKSAAEVKKIYVHYYLHHKCSLLNFLRTREGRRWY